MFHAPVAGGSTRRRQAVSDVEAEEADIAILHDIVAPLEPHLSAFPRRGIGSRGDEVFVGNDLRLDEAAFDIAVDDAGRFRRLRPLADGPGPHFRITRGEEGDEVQQSIGRMDEGRKRRLFQTRVFEEDSSLVIW